MNEGRKQQKPRRGGGWKQFWGFVRKAKLSWGWIILTLAISIAYYKVVTLIPVSTAALYSGDFSMPAIMGLVMNNLIMLALSVVTAVCQLIASARSVRSVRGSVWRRMMNVETGYFGENDPGRLLSAVTSDAEAAVGTLVTIIIMIPSQLMFLMMCLRQLSAYNKKLLAVLFVMVPLYILYALLIGRWQERTGRAIQMKIGGLTGFLTERIRNLPLIKSFATEQKEEEKGVAAAGELYKAKVHYGYLMGVLSAYTFLTEAIGIVVAVIWGSALLRGGEIQLEAWLAFFLFVPMVNNVLRSFSVLWGNIKELQGRAARMGAIMDAPQEERSAAASGEIPAGDLSFRNVHFGYGENGEVLSGLDFTIPQGKATAIVGLSGSGKTTILKLLERLYSPQSGSIQVGGKDIAGLNLHGWREKISYVSQDAAVFSGTVRECLTYGLARQFRDEELMEAAKLAGFDEYIAQQPGALDAPLAIWGSGMSGGQRQRLVIARELLKGADILLLDEPTSALDAVAAAAVSDTFYTRFRGKTIVTVTHELNFIAGADQIIVLNQGKVEGRGSHEELMKSCESYRKLVEEQSYQEVFA